MFLKKGGWKKRGLIHLSALCLICPRPHKDCYELLQTVVIKIFWTWWISKCFSYGCFWSQLSGDVILNLKVPQKVPGMVWWPETCYWFASIPRFHVLIKGIVSKFYFQYEANFGESLVNFCSPLKSPENHKFSADFMGNRGSSIRLHLLVSEVKFGDHPLEGIPCMRI